jgi:hypothetical protein
MLSHPSPTQLTRMVLVVGLALLAPRAMGAPPPAPWTARDIGPLSTPGSTEVDANGTWTVHGSSLGLLRRADRLHFAYQPLSGDGSISARFLGLTATVETSERPCLLAAHLLRDSHSRGASPRHLWRRCDAGPVE